MEVDPLELDTLSPCNDALFIDRKEDMFLQHGGCATRVAFSQVEEMSLATFLQELAKGSEEEFTVIRSPSTQSMMLIRGDRVIRYKDCIFEDVFVDEVVKRLTFSAGTMTYTPMLQFPLIHVHVEGERYVTVQIPKRVVHFFGTSEIGKIEDDITLPPLWFCVQMSASFSPYKAWVGIVDTLDVVPSKCKLRQLCFPNTYNDGSICFGSTRTSAVQVDQMTEALAVSSTIDRFFNSNFNNHVLGHHTSFLAECKPIYEQLEKLPMYERAIASVANTAVSANFLRYLRILHEPDGYMRVQQPFISSSDMAISFLKGAS